ncbi:hypothetical protein FKV73_07420 [Weissella paramesenteroides]|nr:hypothetical protein FKV79_08245 [Weissella paramesenteroides]KAA8436751.1 hypothetical protein FKV73_07420 [Weissella paramesenteroides]
MMSWLMPFAMLPKTYTFFFFDSFAQIAIAVFGLYILGKLYVQPQLLSTVLPKTTTLRLWGVFVVVQLCLMAYQSVKIGNSQQTYGLLHSLVSFIQMILVIWVAYTVQKMAIQSFDDAKKFVKSVIWTIIGYSVIVLMPQILFLLGIGRFSRITNAIASLFERHWLDRDFYNNGSYVTTLFRLNGLEPEASFLALLLGLAFAPLLLMIIQEPIKSFKNHRKLYILSWLIVIFIALVLLYAKTTTGFLIIFILALLYWLMAPRNQKLWLFGLGMIALVGSALAYVAIPSVNDLLNRWLFEKGGTDNRLGGTIGLIGAWLHHPLLGVGYGYEGPYIVDNLPQWSKNNYEYMAVYKNQSYPILNDVFGWLARYGLLFMATGAWLLFGLIKRAMTVLKSLGQLNNPEHIVFYRIVIKAFFVTTAAILIVAAVTPANVTSWPILLMLFFYWRVIHLAEDEVSSK